jgi:L-amino acid N-acyltransferase YncA
VELTEMRGEDWPSVADVYVQGIEDGDATFEEAVPDWRAWDAAHLPTPRLVARDAGAVVGWAALALVSRRPVYRGVAEVSVYVARDARGRGVGRALLRELVARSEAAGVWTLQASVFPENQASVALHASCGFRVVGRRERLAQHRGRWRDVLLLERRSPSVGCENHEP